jgi:exodeoxyribonuclease I
MSNPSNSQATLLWHDYETTGTHKQLDRPTQFAAVRTDLDLNIVGEEVMIYCRPSPETLMHPIAAAVTGLTPQECAEKGLYEVDFCREVLAQMMRRGTCGCGYNTISFDDEITRNMLYRNFQDPYEREWKNGNSRWDLITAVRLFAALRPEGIVWPTKEDGRPSQRLEDLAKANNLKQERAHDALSDVHATILLARLLKSTNQRLWDHAFGLREKVKVQAVASLAQPQRFVHVAPYHAQSGTAIMFPVAAHPTNKNGVIVVNLGADLSALRELDAETIASRLFGGDNEGHDGEKSERLPITMIQINKAPPVAPVKGLRLEDYQRLGYTDEVNAKIDANEQSFRDDPAAFQALAKKLAEAFRIASAKFDAPPADAELGIYGSFPSGADKAMIEKVRNADAQQLADGEFVFDDQKYNDLLFRYRARNWLRTLSDSERARWRDHCVSRLTTQTPATTITIDTYKQEIDRLAAEPARAHQEPIFAALRAWGERLERGFARAQEAAQAPAETPAAPPAAKPFR